MKLFPWLYILLALAGTFGFALVMGFDLEGALFLTVTLFFLAYMTACFVVSRENAAR